MGTSDRNRVQPPTRPLTRANRDAGTLQHEPCSSSGDKGAFRLSQEMIAIVTVGVALAALNLVTTANTANLIQERRAARAAWQAQSTAWQAENHRRREQWELEIQRLHGETRSHLDAFHREISRPRAERP